jgi:membrane protein
VEPAGPVRRMLGGALAFGRDCAGRFVSLQGVDRAAALGGQAFTALIPLLIVYSTVVPYTDGENFADQLIDRFELTGAAARTMEQAFAPPETVADSISFFSVFLLVISALAFTRALQRLYELAHDMPSMGMRGTPWGLLWLAFIVVYVTLRPELVEDTGPALEIALSLVLGGIVWLVTPYLLLARRVPYTRLVPTALLTAVGMTSLTVSSVIWLPRTMASSASQFGFIGVAFAMLGWLVAAGFVLVGTAAAGAAVDARRRGHADVVVSARPSPPS